MNIEQEMYDRVTKFIEKRFPEDWGGAAIIHTEKGSFFTSVAVESANESVLLCIEYVCQFKSEPRADLILSHLALA